jgi:N-dimethylarginine dimethylaminohydrolase
MRTVTGIWLSASVMTAPALWFDRVELAAIVMSLHVLIFFLHRIEVKINKLLDHAGVFVMEYELNE